MLVLNYIIYLFIYFIFIFFQNLNEYDKNKKQTEKLSSDFSFVF